MLKSFEWSTQIQFTEKAKIDVQKKIILMMKQSDEDSKSLRRK